MNIASWNVNSLNVRLTHVLNWLDQHSIDVLCLQEIKMMTEQFPYDVFSERGYTCFVSGQKTYNGVAVISRFPMTDPVFDVMNFADLQRRLLGVTINGIRIFCVYVPNGESVTSDKYLYKLSWLDAFIQHLKHDMKSSSRLAVLGDFNIAPNDLDVHDPEVWRDSVLCSPQERALFEQLLALGLEDSYRFLNKTGREFTWWDYRLNAFKRGMGLRIDHILCSSELVPSLRSVRVDREVRAWERPSDHVPITACFAE